jgi:rhombotail lipoprotein
MNGRVLAFAAILAVMAGCVTFTPHENRRSSSLVSFLYPDGQLPPPGQAVPELHLPLRVGLAFLPSAPGSDGALDEAHKAELLEHIRQHFVDRKFVSEIAIIPDYYLAAGGGYGGLEGLKRLYTFDVLALVSYDQVTNIEANRKSLSYLTILGAFVINGNEHDTATLVDLAVVDPATRSLIVRAGGTDTRRASSALVKVSEDVRLESVASFDAAAERMLGNFDVALTAFEKSVQEGKASVKVVDRRGGGGVLDVTTLALLLLLLAARRGVPPLRASERAGAPRARGHL